MLSFALTTLTTGTFFGLFLGRMLTALGFISLGLLLIPFAIYRAGVCLQGAPEETWRDGERRAVAEDVRRA